MTLRMFIFSHVVIVRVMSKHADIDPTLIELANGIDLLPYDNAIRLGLVDQYHSRLTADAQALLNACIRCARMKT